MMIYADYDYYLNTYGGTKIDDEDMFRRIADIASSEMALYAPGITEATDAVKKCCCEIADVICSYEASMGSARIQSEKVGNYSVTYASSSSMNVQRNEDIQSIIIRRLMNTGMMYRGIFLAE